MRDYCRRVPPNLSLLLRRLLMKSASWGAAAMLRRTETRRRPSTRGEVSKGLETVTSFVERPASSVLYLDV